MSVIVGVDDSGGWEAEKDVEKYVKIDGCVGGNPSRDCAYVL